MGLKATGCYLSRTLSYQGAEFNIARCTLDPIFEEMYDRASKFWQLLHTVCRNLTMGSIGWRMFWGVPRLSACALSMLIFDWGPEILRAWISASTWQRVRPLRQSLKRG